MKNSFKNFDKIFINIINKKIRNKYFDFLFYYLTNLGGVISCLLITLLLIIFGNIKLKKIGYEIAFTLIFSGIIVQILKRIFSRSRPYWILDNLNTFGIDLNDYSFPSGHSTSSFSIAIIFSLNYPELSVLFIAIASLVAISRIYLAVHYPTDVLAGIILGIISAFLTYYVFFPYIVSIKF